VVTVLVDLHGGTGGDQGIPTADGAQTQYEDDDTAEQEDGRLQHGGVQHRLHTAENRVERRDEHQTDGGNPEEVNAPEFLDTEYLLEHQSAGIHRHGHLGEHITDERDDGKDGAALLVVALLQEFRHGIHHTSCIERDEHPSEYQYHPALNFPVGHGHTRRGARSGEADKVFRTDVRCEDGCADGNPCGVFSTEEIIRRVIVLLTDDPHHDTDERQTKDPDNNPV